MQAHFGLEGLLAGWKRSVVCIGTFDGVHLGHQAVIRTAVQTACELGEPSVLVTFDRHPYSVLAPEKCPQAVGTLTSNLRLFEALGVSVAVVLSFSREMAETSAQRFFDETLRGALRAAQVVVGHDFAFGKGRQGTPEWLNNRIPTQIVPPFEIEGKRVSSSAIRAAISEGRVEEAATWLGRPYELAGVVVPGEAIGAKLGFPTANVERVTNQVIPADGVYACECATPFGTFAAAGSVGNRPTVGGDRRTIEAHLIDYTGEALYGRAIETRFLKRLRGQEKFDSALALAAQMERDVRQVVTGRGKR